MDLQKAIEEAVRRPVQIVLTNNRVRMVSFRKTAEGIHLRLHRLFAEAPPEVIGEIAELIKDPSIKTPLMRDFFRRNSRRIKKRPPLTGSTPTAGRVYDLQQIFDEVNREYFSGRVDATITWGRHSLRKAARRRTLGSFNAETRTIRINPALDSPRVPRFFVEYIVYHEMLHAMMGIKRREDGRRAVHTREFRERERLFRHYKEAVTWEGRLAGKGART